MVTIHPINRVQKGETPMMWRHNLEATKETKTFKENERHVCMISKMDNGRFGVFSASFAGGKYEVIESEKDLHESFQEIE